MKLCHTCSYLCHSGAGAKATPQAPPLGGLPKARLRTRSTPRPHWRKDEMVSKTNAKGDLLILPTIPSTDSWQSRPGEGRTSTCDPLLDSNSKADGIRSKRNDLNFAFRQTTLTRPPQCLVHAEHEILIFLYIKQAEHGGGDFEEYDNRTLQLQFTDGSTFCFNVESPLRADGMFFKKETVSGKPIFKS